MDSGYRIALRLGQIYLLKDSCKLLHVSLGVLTVNIFFLASKIFQEKYVTPCYFLMESLRYSDFPVLLYILRSSYIQ